MNAIILKLSIVLIILISLAIIIFQRKQIIGLNGAKKRLNKYYNLLNIWLYHKNNNKSLGDHIRDNGYKRIAIYGMGEIGGRLYEELKLSGIKVEAFIEKETGDYTHGYDEIPFLSAKEGRDQYMFDVIIVTPIYDFDKIYKELIGIYPNADIFSVEKLIN